MGLAGQEGQKAGVHSQWEGSARGQGRGRPRIWPQSVTGRGASELLRGREPGGWGARPGGKGQVQGRVPGRGGSRYFCRCLRKRREACGRHERLSLGSPGLVLAARIQAQERPRL